MQTSNYISVSNIFACILSLTMVLPASAACQQNQGKSPFEYKEAYLPENINPTASAAEGMNNVDYDWGLWGHHLSKAIGKDAPENDYALVDGQRDHDQYCFSSEDTYKRICNYILDNFGDGTQEQCRFAIFPEDNELACTCKTCRDAGNTKGNATPAMTLLINRLASRFPKHLFFTSSYLSTATIPTVKLAANAGVIISAMDFPITPGRSDISKSFDNKLNSWKAVSDRIYIWDYINNFDNYFSPFPILNAFSSRLQYYESKGVKGVFLNGSGNSYSSFSGLYWYVLNRLMDNPSADIHKLTSEYFRKDFPTSGKVLQSYIESVESNAVSKNKKLNIYGGITDELRTFLNAEEFFKFYDSLGGLITKTKGSERLQLEKLRHSLSFTSLEILRQRNSADRTYEMSLLKELGKCSSYKDMVSYNESGNTVSEYIEGWKKYILPIHINNLLKGCRLHQITEQDEDYTDTKTLTDNAFGLPSDYHCGWYVSSLTDTVKFELPIALLKKAKKMECSFLDCPKRHYSVPSSVYLSIDGKIAAEFKSLPLDGAEKYSRVSIGGEVSLANANKAELVFVKNISAGKLIGCDEISFY
jgi:hypothetical protein